MTTAVPARSPEDDALDRLDHLSGILDAQLARDENGAPIGMQLRAIAATVREALERLRRHPDAWSQEAFDQQKARAESAEAEARRLTEGLRPFAKQPCGKFSPSWDGPEFVPCGECKTCIARALLSADPPQGDAAEGPTDGGCEHEWVREHGSDGHWCVLCGAGPSDGGMSFDLHRRIEPLPILSARETAAIYKRSLLALMADARLDLCGVVCGSSWHDPVACAFPPEHDGPHSWASIPALPPDGAGGGGAK